VSASTEGTPVGGVSQQSATVDLPRSANLLVLGALACAGWFSAPTLVVLHEQWLGSELEHGYVVVLACVWLIARAVRAAPLVPLSTNPASVLVVVAAVCGMLAARASSILLAEQALLPILWIATLYAVVGTRNAQRFVLPICYLYFAIPVWDVLNDPLRMLTVRVVSMWLRLADVPAFMDGDLIHIPSGVFEIAGGCSGSNYLVVGLSLASLLGLLNHDAWRPRLVLFLTGLVLALCTNWLRVFTIIVAGHMTEMRHFLVSDSHYTFGWLLFLAVCVVPLLLVDHWLRGRWAAPAPSAASSVAPWRARVASAVCATAIAGAWSGNRLAVARGAVDSGTTTVALGAPAVPGWRIIGDWRDTRRPVFAASSGEAAAWYASGPDQVGAYVANYSHQRQEAEVVGYGNRPEGANAAVLARAERVVRAASGTDIPIAELEVDDGGDDRRLVWLALQVAGRDASGELEAKMLQVLGAFTGRFDAQAVVLTAECAADCAAARDVLDRFLAEAIQHFYVCARAPLLDHSERACVTAQ
jgi:EpsI family protein